MALTDESTNGMVMPVAPMYGGGYGGNGFGTGGDWAWIILLLLAFGGGWGNGFGKSKGAEIRSLFRYDFSLAKRDVFANWKRFILTGIRY